MSDMDHLIEGYPIHEDAFGVTWTDHGPNEQPNLAGPYVVAVHFNTLTTLEAELIVSAISGFVRRRTPAFDITIEYTNQGDTE